MGSHLLPMIARATSVARLGLFNPKSAQTKPAQTKSAQTKSAQTKSAQTKSAWALYCRQHYRECVSAIVPAWLRSA
jgi:hypothetical protein